MSVVASDVGGVGRQALGLRRRPTRRGRVGVSGEAAGTAQASDLGFRTVMVIGGLGSA